VSRVIEVDDASFEHKVIGSPRPVLADFSAVWCGPCRRLEPIVEALAEDYAGRVDVVRIDVDGARETAARFGIMSVPTVLFFKGGVVADQINGVAPREKLAARLDRLLE
jgi:thioredoxin 1